MAFCTSHKYIDAALRQKGINYKHGTGIPSHNLHYYNRFTYEKEVFFAFFFGSLKTCAKRTTDKVVICGIYVICRYKDCTVHYQFIPPGEQMSVKIEGNCKINDHTVAFCSLGALTFKIYIIESVGDIACRAVTVFVKKFGISAQFSPCFW